MLGTKWNPGSPGLLVAVTLLVALACGPKGSENTDDGGPVASVPPGGRCATDADCQSGLCFRESAALFRDGGPPGGLCTSACSADADCPSSFVCTETKAGNRCLPGCDFGDDANKCAGRPELACEPYLRPSGRDCEGDAECGVGELCFTEERRTGPDATDGKLGTCEAVLGVCTPRCASDANCSGGRFCNRASGECDAVEPEGLAFGASCDPKKKECAGDCVEIASSLAECEERCRIGASAGCGVDELAGSKLVCGFFAYDLGSVAADQGSGDTGVCAMLCQCNDECPGDQLCLNNPVGKFAGLCAGGLTFKDTLPCPDTSGLGGAGGNK